LYDEGDDECRDEGRYTLDDQCKLLGYTVVNIISVRRSLRRN
jgi:rRNA maturation protein Nop10